MLIGSHENQWIHSESETVNKTHLIVTSLALRLTDKKPGKERNWSYSMNTEGTMRAERVQLGNHTVGNQGGISRMTLRSWRGEWA